MDTVPDPVPATKPKIASKTLWVNGVAFFASVTAAAGFDLGLTAEVQTSLVTAVLAIVNIVLRLVTKEALV